VPYSKPIFGIVRWASVNTGIIVGCGYQCFIKSSAVEQRLRRVSRLVAKCIAQTRSQSHVCSLFMPLAEISLKLPGSIVRYCEKYRVVKSRFTWCKIVIIAFLTTLSCSCLLIVLIRQNTHWESANPRNRHTYTHTHIADWSLCWITVFLSRSFTTKYNWGVISKTWQSANTRPIQCL